MVFTNSAFVPLPGTLSRDIIHGCNCKFFLRSDADVGIIMPLLSFMFDTSNLSPRPCIDCQMQLGMSPLASRDNSNQQRVNPLSWGYASQIPLTPTLNSS